MRIQITATTESPDLVQKLLQHIQDFNVLYTDSIHFDVLIDAPEISHEKALGIIDSLTPALPYREFIPFKRHDSEN